MDMLAIHDPLRQGDDRVLIREVRDDCRVNILDVGVVLQVGQILAVPDRDPVIVSPVQVELDRPVVPFIFTSTEGIQDAPLLASEN